MSAPLRERRIPLDGAVNFRDLGGYIGADGRAVKWGRVFRSDHLADLSDADLATLQGLGVRHICDLRRDAERDSFPNRLPPGATITIDHLPIGGAAAETNGMAARMLRGEITEVTIESMAGIYLLILDMHPDAIATVIERAADPSRHALVIHCTAGKDRTGLASAMLLHALGVDDELIFDDYYLTTGYYSAAREPGLRAQMESVGVPFDNVATFFNASRDVIAATFAHVRDEHGSIDAYLTGHAGIGRDVIDQLRAELLENAPQR